MKSKIINIISIINSVALNTYQKESLFHVGICMRKG